MKVDYLVFVHFYSVSFAVQIDIVCLLPNGHLPITKQGSN